MNRHERSAAPGDRLAVARPSHQNPTRFARGLRRRRQFCRALTGATSQDRSLHAGGPCVSSPVPSRSRCSPRSPPPTTPAQNLPDLLPLHRPLPRPRPLPRHRPLRRPGHRAARCRFALSGSCPRAIRRCCSTATARPTSSPRSAVRSPATPSTTSTATRSPSTAAGSRSCSQPRRARPDPPRPPQRRPPLLERGARPRTPPAVASAARLRGEQPTRRSQPTRLHPMGPPWPTQRPASAQPRHPAKSQHRPEPRRRFARPRPLVAQLPPREPSRATRPPQRIRRRSTPTRRPTPTTIRRCAPLRPPMGPGAAPTGATRAMAADSTAEGEPGIRVAHAPGAASPPAAPAVIAGDGGVRVARAPDASPAANADAPATNATDAAGAPVRVVEAPGAEVAPAPTVATTGAPVRVVEAPGAAAPTAGSATAAPIDSDRRTIDPARRCTLAPAQRRVIDAGCRVVDDRGCTADAERRTVDVDGVIRCRRCPRCGHCARAGQANARRAGAGGRVDHRSARAWPRACAWPARPRGRERPYTRRRGACSAGS